MKAIIKFLSNFYNYLSKNGLKKTIFHSLNCLGIKKADKSPSAKNDFLSFFEQNNKSIKFGSSAFVKITDNIYKRDVQDPKVIAWYLPQYYRIDVNDKFHGAGFTEWTNSSQAIPLFTGHYQPHIPYDVGYYNLLNIESIKRQITLAKMYGIYGFCFHWYWFSGKRTMEKPVELLLKHKELNIPFCLNWATENWTTVWDGGNKDIIFEQKLEKNDAQRFMKDVLPYFKDKRYIKIDNRPVLSIYNARIFEKQDFIKLTSAFRNIAKKNGFKDLYILICNFAGFDEDVKSWGGDALVEFPPAGLEINQKNPTGYINPNFNGCIFDVDDFIKNRKYLKSWKNTNVYRSALTSFDNSPRKAYGKNCIIFQGASPFTYKSWLKDIIAENKKYHTKDDNIVFVNSWNEWAEGSHLEPDLKYGYAYLHATKEALEETRVNQKIVTNKINDFLKLNKKITFYIHCIESMGDIVAAEPIARYLKSKAKNSRIIWIVKKEYKPILEFNPNIDEILTVNILSDSIKILHEIAKEEGNIIIDCHYDYRRSSITNEIHRNLNNPAINEQTYYYYGSLLESFCLSAGLPKLNKSPKFYLNPEIRIKVPENKYIVIHAKSAESCRNWDIEKWHTLVKWITNFGFTVLEIGFTPIIEQNRIHNDKYINFTMERDLQKIAHIINKSTCFVGIDSGFAHFANALNIPGVILLGKYKNFDFYMPYTGNYSKGINSKIIYANKDYAKTIPVKNVQDALTNILNM